MGMEYIGIGALLFENILGGHSGSPRPPMPLPPRNGESCVNSTDIYIPLFNEETDAVGSRSNGDVALFDDEGDQISPWYNVSTVKDEICVGKDEELLITFLYASVNKGLGHSYIPVMWSYGKDGVSVSKGVVTPAASPTWK